MNFLRTLRTRLLGMLKCLLFTSFIFFIAIPCSRAGTRQSHPPVRFSGPVFEKVLVKKDGVYNETPPAGIKAKYYRFDFYEPDADSSNARPLIIWLHGGGFKFGKKTLGGLPL